VHDNQVSDPRSKRSASEASRERSELVTTIILYGFAVSLSSSSQSQHFLLLTQIVHIIRPLAYGGNKELLSTAASFLEPIKPCEVDIRGVMKTYDYTLQVHFIAMNWFSLLNGFEFTWDVYLGFFTLVGIVTIGVAAMIWSINRLLTKLRHPPVFHSTSLLTIISGPPFFGVFLATVPWFVTVSIAKLWFGDGAGTYGFFAEGSSYNFQDVHGDWLDVQALSDDRIQTYRIGRMGCALLAIGLYSTVLSASLIVPEWLDEHSEDADGNEIAGGGGDIGIDDDEDEEIVPPSPGEWRAERTRTICVALWLSSLSRLLLASLTVVARHLHTKITIT